MNSKFQFAIDRGGTFTDFWSKCPDGSVKTMKLLSEDPDNYPDAPREGIKRIMEEYTKVPHDVSDSLDASSIEWIRMGTTVATNALLERKGQRMALVITKGFKDLLYIGNQARPNIFDLEIVTPEVLYEDVIEVEERVVLKQEKCEINKQCPTFTGTTGEQVEIWEDLNTEKLKVDLKRISDNGIKSIAVVLMHSFIYADHEKRVGELAGELGFDQISLSSQIMAMVRIVPRGYTACADAYLTPSIRQYVQGFAGGFKQSLEEMRVLFMQSDGGLTPVQKFSGCKAILSGPAGGVIGYAMTTYSHVTKRPVIGFDMGGTSTDVSRYAGHFEHSFDSTTAGVTIQAPQLDINTVAAGGGSMLFFRAGMFVVGPESAGAHPGPVCYKKGGYLAVTDANLCLGRLLPEYFPAIFGPNESESLDKKSAMAAFRELSTEVNNFLCSQENGSRKVLSVEEIAMGFIRVANETMCRPIRSLTQAKGFDTAGHVLACFGGAGAQHACAIARNLGMTSVFVHRHAGILSAFGLALADVVHEAQEPCASVYSTECFHHVDIRFDHLSAQCVQELESQGFERDRIQIECFLHLRYEHTDCALMCSGRTNPASAHSSRHGHFEEAFTDRYRQEFGFVIPNRRIIIDDIRVRGVGKSAVTVGEKIPTAGTGPARAEQVTECYFEDGYQTTAVYRLEKLLAEHEIPGPAIIMSSNSTILVEPDCHAVITEFGDVQITIGRGHVMRVGPDLDAIQLSIFSHRFMSTAEQMGRVLQRTAISTNIKERLDFSCALFGPDGGLVANAPHIPVHLGAMQEAVQFQMRNLEGNIHRGDVILSNHPMAGGSHLPDLTVITPVFYQDLSDPVFFVACRGHHADIGGSMPGSMPPFSTSIHEEGAVFISFKLVKEGVFQEESVVEVLNAPGMLPGCSGSRNLSDNLSDLKAQVAANQKGIHLVCQLIDEYGLHVVQAYMAHIQANAELAVRDMLREVGEKYKEADNGLPHNGLPHNGLPHNGLTHNGLARLCATDSMDDGSEIQLAVTININEGSAVFDFTGTSDEVYGNLNAPRAITFSALIYCLRCMVGHNVPLNQGCLTPIRVVVPKGCLLDPSPDAAVVGGNVQTSQRIVDVVFKAFQTCAASQGCMNNVTFGDDTMGYYETVAGGAGAGPTWHGRSGVHTHMTNTKITDPEILERRYPVVLEQFNLRAGSGGPGLYRGGDGVIREMLFRKTVSLGVLSERRVLPPYGLHGGNCGWKGKNTFTFRNGRRINFRGKGTIEAHAGDRFRLETPGGGGYGTVAAGHVTTSSETSRSHPTYSAKGSVHQYKMNQESA